MSRFSHLSISFITQPVSLDLYPRRFHEIIFTVKIQYPQPQPLDLYSP